MSQKHIENLKASQPYKTFDWIVYIVIAVLIIVLFFVVFNKNGDKLDGIDIFCGESKIYEFDFDAEKSTIYDADKIEEEKKNGKIFVKVYYKDGFNIIEIDVAKRAVRVFEADCSSSKECVHTPSITNSKGSIVCIPHKIIVQGKGNGANNPSVG